MAKLKGYERGDVKDKDKDYYDNCGKEDLHWLNHAIAGNDKAR